MADTFTLQYKQISDFPKSLQGLWRMGGPYQKAADRVKQILANVTLGEVDPFVGIPMTNHGENRISKCIKYDLPNFARLVTIQDSGVVLFCYAGAHEAVDKWIDANRGLMLAKAAGQLIPMRESLTIHAESVRLSGSPAYTSGALYGRLQPETFDELVEGLPRSIVRNLEALESTCTDGGIYESVKDVADEGRQAAIYDVFVFLRNDCVREAEDRIKLFLSKYTKLETLTAEEIAELADSDRIKTIPSNDPRFAKVFEHFAKSAKYVDWMLFLHPDQADKVDRDFDGPSKLVGVSGSGKTCVAVKRAIRLAEKYPGERILILTLNTPLARLIGELVDVAALPEIRSQLDVRPFFRLCQELLHGFEPESDKLYDERTWKSGEHIDEIWREYYRCELNNSAAEVLLPVHDSLIMRDVEAEAYVREEFDWIRSAVPSTDRSRYRNIERVGRSIGFEMPFRNAILAGLEGWERKMRDVGATDYLGLATALTPYIDDIQPQYRCILVDESQDFGTTELAIIRKLVREQPNDLFLCGDAAQQVSAKHQSFAEAGIAVPSARSLSIRKNYRNCREVLAAAYAVLETNLTDEMLYSESFELLEPEYANFSGATPLLLEAPSLEQEIGLALRYLADEANETTGKMGCLAICGYSIHELSAFAQRAGVPLLDGMSSIGQGHIYMSDLEQTKGFEFEVVVIVNCREGVMPDHLKPAREQFRDLARFYVAMTRAKHQLVLSYSGQRSVLLKQDGKYFLEARWTEYFPVTVDGGLGLPARLDVIRRHAEEEEKKLGDMAAKEFLYTERALGLDAALIQELRASITGKSRMVDGIPVEWKDMQAAAVDFKRIPRVRLAFGPVTGDHFLRLCERIGL